jgi:FkbM family methyltransferase
LRTGHEFRRICVTNVMTLVGLAKLFENDWKVIDASGDIITIRQDNLDLTFRLRTDVRTDSETLVATFVRQVYDSSFEDKVVVDVGMYIGDSSIYFARKGSKLVVGLEPSSPSFGLAKENISLNNMEGSVIPLNCALSSTEGEATLAVSSHNPNENSIAAENVARWAAFDSREKTRTITLEGVMEQFGLKRIDFLKINCEGCEYDVIENISANTLEKINELRVSFHDGPREIGRKLTNCGFTVEVSEIHRTLTARRA